MDLGNFFSFRAISKIIIVLIGLVVSLTLTSELVLAQSQIQETKFDIVGLPYVMSDYENCNPRTLKTPGGQDCWQNWSISFPADRADYYLGSFGSHYGVMWNETHVGPNQFDWSALDNYLANAAQMSLRMTDGSTLSYKPVVLVASDFLQSSSNPHDGQKDFISYAPSFVRQSLGENNFQISLDGCDTQDQPPYHLSSFQTYYREWITALGQHLQQSPHAYVVQAVLIGGGLSDEAHPTKSLNDCRYRTQYSSQHQAGYDQFYLSLQDWMKQALLPQGSLNPVKPIFAQIAAASPPERVKYARTAWEKGIGIKLNSLAPSNANAINTKLSESSGGRGALHDYPAMTNLLSQPRAFEPAYFNSSPTEERCSSRYCFSDARYQFTYWNFLNALSLKADFVDFQKEFFNRMNGMKSEYGMDWFSIFLEQSFGKAPNQTATAWVAFADKLNNYDSYPNPRPVVPEFPGNGDYLPAEFTDRGDRDFYLYRLGDYEDSSLIRAQGGMLLGDTENYALRTNSCYKTTPELADQANKILSGEELRNSGQLSASQFAHPFSTTALTTEGNLGKKFISLVLEPTASRIKSGGVSISVWYLDNGNDSFSLEFMDDQGNLQTRSQTKTDTKTWKEARWSLQANEISFDQNLSGMADLRLNCDCQNNSGDDVFHMVKITASNPGAVPSLPTAELQYCGQGGGGGGSCQNESADLNNDGLVNLSDFSIFVGQWFQSGQNRADLNCDQIVDLRDFSLFSLQFNL